MKAFVKICLKIFEEKSKMLCFGQHTFGLHTVSFFQALNDAKQELRFLLVYLHGKDHQASEGFCRGTLGNQEVIAFVNTSMLFWACDTNSPEGYRGENQHTILFLFNTPGDITFSNRGASKRGVKI